MTARIALIATLLAFPSAAHAGDISGWWTISGASEARTTGGAEGGYFSYAPPPANTAQPSAGPAQRPAQSPTQGQVFACVYNRDGTPTEGSRAFGCSERPGAGALYRSEPRVEASNPKTCGFSGQLAVKESKPGTARGECALSLIYSCGDPGRHMSVVQACTMTRKGNAITIRGANPEISEAVPPHAWPTSYSPDTLLLTLSSDGKSMTGKLAGKPKSVVRLGKFLDIVE